MLIFLVVTDYIVLKIVYGKVKDQIEHLHLPERNVDESINGVSSESSAAHRATSPIARMSEMLKQNIFQSDSIEPKLKRKLMFIMLSYCYLASMSSSFNAIFLKSTLELTISTETDNWNHWLPYVLMVLSTCCTIFTEYWRQKALKDYGALYVVPIILVIILVGGTTVGAIYFDELSGLPAWRLVVFILSVAIIVSGICFISWPNINQKFDRIAVVSAANTSF